MSLKEKIAEDLKTAMKEKDEVRKNALAMLRSRIQNKEIEKQKKEEGLTDEEIYEVIASEVKQRKEALEGFEKGGRSDLAQKEAAEQKILESYLPPQASPEEIRAELESVIEESGTRSKKDFGMLMGKAMTRLKGKADGSVVRSELEKLLE